jgi:hypothetical protein
MVTKTTSIADKSNFKIVGIFSWMVPVPSTVRFIDDGLFHWFLDELGKDY